MKKTVLCILCALLLAGCAGGTVPQNSTVPSETSGGSTSFADPQSSGGEVLETSGETSEETSTPDSEDLPEKPSWEQGELFFVASGARFEYREKLTLIDSTEELQKLVDTLDWKSVSDKVYETNMAQLAVCDETFFETHTLAFVLLSLGGGPYHPRFEQIRWLEDGTDGKTRAEILIRTTVSSMGWDDFYNEIMMVIPISKAASSVCDELTLRYLQDVQQADGHIHAEPVDSVKNGEPMTYQKGTPVEITRKGAVWRTESELDYEVRTDVLPDGELAYRLMELLEGLQYSESGLCACGMNYDDLIAWKPIFCVAGEYYVTDDFVRCARGQAYLTQAERALVGEVRESIKTTERGFYPKGMEPIFYLRYDETPSLFADGNTVLITEAEEWETLMSEVEPFFTFSLLGEYGKDVQKMFADYSLILRLIPAEDGSYYNVSRRLWSAESGKATIILHHDADTAAERVDCARLICVPVEKHFASELKGFSFAELQTTFCRSANGRHRHSQSYETLTIGSVPDYPDDLSVTVEHGGKTYTASGETAKKLMAIMDTLHYQTEYTCSCALSDMDEVYRIDGKYDLALSDYLAREGKKQVFLTASQTDRLEALLDEIVK